MFDTTPLVTSTQAMYGAVDAFMPRVNIVYESRVSAASSARRQPNKANDSTETQQGRISAARRKRRPSGVDVPAAVFSRFVDALADGDHEFATLRETFMQWLGAIDAEPVSDVMLAKWLKGAGLVKRRVGRAKVTVYRKGP